ncbi:3-deoxy-D-manno-octulosonic acid transferase [Thalassobium sp. R2A62]|uniref:3-deoxy-D-manno-octulosonic acid transferase n=1 Tax=Thalassobium sp. R2A62 TaxID=633131 RepID=UPI0001B1CA71|nr:glycosyltransferase N-terminal domain-containing protein [Thalassobium sp. R2A62]EET48223.1 three-deoxy-D-manno-octulosonic-acid transferase domain protein [Thalassobium sp. R2A62]
MLIYRVLISMVAPVVVVMTLFRVLRGREDWNALRGRFGGGHKARACPTWVHGASNGELASARRVIETLAQAHSVLVTCNTVTARDMVRGWANPDIIVQLAPIDLRWVISQTIRRHDVKTLLVIENEIWPNRMAVAAKRDVQVILLGARLSTKSAAMWMRFRGVSQKVFAPVVGILPQDRGSAERFASLGVSKSMIGEITDLKPLAVKDAPKTVHPAFDRAATILFASTHPGEEAALLAAFSLVREQHPDMRAILAPRHPRRATELRELAQGHGFRVDQRSAGDDTAADVYLADTMGEMSHWFKAASVSFIGGSLVDKGGHTPYEPAAYGSTIIHGPHTSNFAGIYQQLDTEGGAAMAKTPEEIAAIILTHMSGSPMPEVARRVVAPSQTIDEIVAQVRAMIG